MMRFSFERRAVCALPVAALLLALPAAPAAAQAPAPAAAPPPAPAASMIDQLVGADNAIDIDLAALKQKAAERIQARVDPQALRRPPIAPQLDKLPHFDFEVVFDPDASLVRPPSYQMLGRIADAMSDPKLLPYAFLIVDHVESLPNGNRKENLALSQRRADSIRLVLANTFKISGKRLFALGLGEEQLRDAARPAAPANARAQIIAIGKRPDETPAAPAAAAAAKKSTPAKKKRSN
jgi:outer membrane protein OmpA-like peptidoglycan-associated protein